jgi:hypothetical protein
LRLLRLCFASLLRLLRVRTFRPEKGRPEQGGYNTTAEQRHRGESVTAQLVSHVQFHFSSTNNRISKS